MSFGGYSDWKGGKERGGGGVDTKTETKEMKLEERKKIRKVKTTKKEKAKIIKKRIKDQQNLKNEGP